MGCLEEVREELEQLAKEIDADATASQRSLPRHADSRAIPPTHVRLQLFVPLESLPRLQIEVSITKTKVAEDA